MIINALQCEILTRKYTGLHYSLRDEKIGHYVKLIFIGCKLDLPLSEELEI